MMREQHRLGMLHMRIARQNDVEVLLGLLNERMTQRNVGVHEVMRALFRKQTRVCCHLVVAASSGMETCARIADVRRQSSFDGHVNVFIVDVEREVPRLYAILHALETGINGISVFVRNDADLRQHVRMRFRSGDILSIQSLVDRQGSAKALRKFAYVFGKTSRPQSHGTTPFPYLQRAFRPDATEE